MEGFLKSNVAHHVDLVVNERLLRDITPAVVETQSSVRKWCCFNKGDVWMRASFDKNAYVPGEVARIMLEIDNRSTVDLRNIEAKLMQSLSLSDNSGACTLGVLWAFCYAAACDVYSGCSLCAGCVLHCRAWAHECDQDR